ncbi:hypothetical protein ACJ5H0_06985 [Chryseobacterium proteolyticum]
MEIRHSTEKKKKNRDVEDQHAFFYASSFQYLHKIRCRKTTDDNTADDVGIKGSGCMVPYIHDIDDQEYRSIEVDHPPEQLGKLDTVFAVDLGEHYKAKRLAQCIVVGVQCV